MDRRVVLVANLREHAQLFEKLATQCLNQGLAGFNFPSREFPKVGEVGVGRASGEQNSFVSSNDCGDYKDHKVSILLEK